MAYTHASIKFKVFVCIHYEDMKGEAKCRKWGGLGWLGVTEGHQQYSIQRTATGLPIQLRRLCVYLVQFTRHRLAS